MVRTLERLPAASTGCDHRAAVPADVHEGTQRSVAPANDHGFLVDNAYGYGKAMELPDGSLFITYLSTGGHRTQDAQSNSSTKG